MKVTFNLHIFLALITFTAAASALEVTTSYQKRVVVATPPPPLKELTLSFSGDLMQHLPQISAARTAEGTFDYSHIFQHIDTVCRSVDFAVINYETTVSTNGKYSGYPMFSSPVEVAAQIANSGIDVVALANNHCLDKGRKGLQKTIQIFDSLGIETIGAYQDSLSSEAILMLNKAEFRVAMLNYTYSTNGMAVPHGAAVNFIDTVQMLQDITKARMDSAATHIIAFMHWGVEYERRANAKQERIGMWLRSKGVDVVIGSHPHVVQNIDTLNRIVYSLGNFISNQQDRYTDNGLTVVVKLTHKAPANMAYIPHWCDKFAPTVKQKYRILTERDTVLLDPQNRDRLRNALSDARQAVGAATEIRL